MTNIPQIVSVPDATPNMARRNLDTFNPCLARLRKIFPDRVAERIAQQASLGQFLFILTEG
jgi:hypothetical protein